ncbi:hypothetical protein Tco_1219891 [Tanacetum coccineum]
MSNMSEDIQCAGRITRPPNADVIAGGTEGAVQPRNKGWTFIARHDVVVQDVHRRYNANNQGKPFQRNNARGNVVVGNLRGTRAHRTKICPWPMQIKIQTSSKTDASNASPGEWCITDKDSRCFLQRLVTKLCWRMWIFTRE